MTNIRTCLTAATASVAIGGVLVLVVPLVEAQQQPATQPMGFFVTSVAPGNGANLGGVDGADKHCQTRAGAVGASNRTWRAYLSTQGANAVNARDRIGPGPWYNAKGQVIRKPTALTEKGETVNGVTSASNEVWASGGLAISDGTANEKA